MEERKQHIDQLYRDKQEQFAALPPNAWDAMDKKLGTEGTAGNSGNSGGTGGGGGLGASIPAQYHWLLYVVITASVALVTWNVLKPSKTADKQKTEQQVAEWQKPEEQRAERQEADIQRAEKEEDKNAESTTGVNKKEDNTINETNSSKESAINTAANTMGDIADVKNNQPASEAQKTEVAKNDIPATDATNSAGKEPTSKAEQAAKTLVKQQVNAVSSHKPSYKEIKPKTTQGALAKKGQPAVAYQFPQQEDNEDKQGAGPMASNDATGNETKVHSKQQVKPIKLHTPYYNAVKSNTSPGGAMVKKGQPAIAHQLPQEENDKYQQQIIDPITPRRVIAPGPYPVKETSKELIIASCVGRNTIPIVDTAFDYVLRLAAKLGENTMKELKNKKDRKAAATVYDNKVANNTVAAAPVAEQTSAAKETPAQPATKMSRKERKQQEKETAANASPKQSVQDDKATASREEKSSNKSEAASNSAATNNNVDVAKGSSAGRASMSGMKSTFEFGFKAGYELGFANDAVNRLLAAPYLQYNITDRFSIGIQPGIRYGAAKTMQVPEDAAYYQPRGTTYDSQMVQSGGLLRWQYVFQHSYDSTAVTYESTNGANIEIELPVMLRYQLTDQIAFTAGVNFISGALPSLAERKETYNGQVLIDTILASGNSPAWEFPDTSNSFVHTARPYSEYRAFTGGMPASNPLRIGYMLGIQYTRRRWLLEADMMQQVSGLSNITNEQVKKRYAQPYFRITLGLRFMK